MCAGRIRVALGTTEKFGIGVNVQTRLKAEIHADLPQRPDQVEQREGRIARSGNTFAEVEIYRVISEPRDVNSPKAHDLQRAQLLERKQTFLTQFRSGNRLGRRIEDVAGDVRLSPQLFALAKAQATGNPLAMEKIKLEHELRQVSLLDRSHKLTHHHNRQELDRAEMQGAYLKTLLPKQEATLEQFRKHERRDEHGALLSLKVVFNDHEFSKLKDANDYLREHPGLIGTTRLQVNSVDIPVDLTEKIVNQKEGLFKRMIVAEYQFAGKWHDAPRAEDNGVGTSQSLLTSILARSRDLPDDIADTTREIAENKQLLTNLQAEVDKKSPYAEKLAQYETRLEEVQAELMKNVKEPVEIGDVSVEDDDDHEIEQLDKQPGFSQSLDGDPLTVQAMTESLREQFTERDGPSTEGKLGRDTSDSIPADAFERDTVARMQLELNADSDPKTIVDTWAQWMSERGDSEYFGRLLYGSMTPAQQVRWGESTPSQWKQSNVAQPTFDTIALVASQETPRVGH